MHENTDRMTVGQNPQNYKTIHKTAIYSRHLASSNFDGGVPRNVEISVL